MKKTVCIVHYNTPELIRAAVMSLRKHGFDGEVVVFENSDKKPLGCDGIATDVTVIDNSRGQIVDFERELEKYPRKNKAQGCQELCVYGSVKHMMSVEWLLQNLEGPFVLADSDILVKASIDELFDDGVTAAGTVEREWSYGVDRLLPFLCWINAPECRRLGIHFFDPMRSWGLGTGKTAKENWYDTGASFLEDVRNCPEATLKKVDIDELMVHLGNGSWKRQGRTKGWLYIYRELWNPDYEYDGPLEEAAHEIKQQKTMEHVHSFTQDGKQYHMVAEEGYLLRAKDTGDVRQVVNTMKLDRWEVIVDPTFVAAKPQPTEKAKRRKGKKA